MRAFFEPTKFKIIFFVVYFGVIVIDALLPFDQYMKIFNTLAFPFYLGFIIIPSPPNVIDLGFASLQLLTGLICLSLYVYFLACLFSYAFHKIRK
jgi:hypothetical protein